MPCHPERSGAESKDPFSPAAENTGSPHQSEDWFAMTGFFGVGGRLPPLHHCRGLFDDLFCDIHGPVLALLKDAAHIFADDADAK